MFRAQAVSFREGILVHQAYLDCPFELSCPLDGPGTDIVPLLNEKFFLWLETVGVMSSWDSLTTGKGKFT